MKTPKEVIYEKYSNLFDFTDKIIKKYNNFLHGKNDDTLSKGIASFHFTRAIHLLEAIKILCLEGYATEALVVLRSLLNLYINIYWMTDENAEYRTRRYTDFEYIYKKKTIDLLKKHQLTTGDQKKDTELNKKVEIIIKKYRLNFKKYNDLVRWSGKSLYNMAKDVHLTKEYDIIYSYLSTMEHTASSSVRSYLDKTENGRTIVKSGPKEENVRLALWTAIGYFVEVKDITYNIFGLASEESKIEKKKLEDLNKKI